jgi:hypothetical protein
MQVGVSKSIQVYTIKKGLNAGKERHQPSFYTLLSLHAAAYGEGDHLEGD